MKRMFSTAPTLSDIFIVIVVVVGLGWLAMPVIEVGPVKGGQQTQVLSNMRQLYLATQAAARDGGGNTDLPRGWPGDTGGDFAKWASSLVSGGYLSTNDLCKLLSAAGRLTPPGHLPLTNDTAVLVYAAKASSPSNTVFLSSANFTNSPEGGLPITTNARPFGQKGFVIFHKAGDGVILQNRQVGTNYTNVIGGYVPFCK
ncbi:hypothetical protein BH09VER1_BH09VER1_45890 [soil metagenome]